MLYAYFVRYIFPINAFDFLSCQEENVTGSVGWIAYCVHQFAELRRS